MAIFAGCHLLTKTLNVPLNQQVISEFLFMKLKLSKMKVVFLFSKYPKIPLAKIFKLKIWLDLNPVDASMLFMEICEICEEF